MIGRLKKYVFRRIAKDGTVVKQTEFSTNDERYAKAMDMSFRGIGSELTPQDKDAFVGIKELQSEFQKKYCASCINFDPKKNDFTKKGHQNNPSNCFYHWTGIIGECWNYRPREDPNIKLK